jgi:aspartate/methionine/tyrosine aminotransferase
MYIWAKLPDGIDDLEFCMGLVAEQGVALSPGRGFGPGGHGHVRMALVQPVEVLRECADKIAKHIQQLRSRK